MSPAAARASVRLWPWWIGLGAGLTASCLLTTSLDGLEGPPLSSDGGVPDAGSESDGGAVDIVRADVSDVATDGGSADSGPDEGGNVEDAPILDADADADATARCERAARRRRQSQRRPAGNCRARRRHLLGPNRRRRRHRSRAEARGSPSASFHMTPNAFDVAVDDDYVYWSTGTDNEVHRKSLDAGRFEQRVPFLRAHADVLSGGGQLPAAST